MERLGTGMKVTQINNPLRIETPEFFEFADCALPENRELYQELITQDIESDMEPKLKKIARSICFECDVLPDCFSYHLTKDTVGITAGMTPREWDSDRRNIGIKVDKKLTVRGRK